MTQAKLRFASFEDYLSSSNEMSMEGRYELIAGELAELPPESDFNIFIADYLQFVLASTGVIPLKLIKTGRCERDCKIFCVKGEEMRSNDLVTLLPETTTYAQHSTRIVR